MLITFKSRDKDASLLVRGCLWDYSNGYSGSDSCEHSQVATRRTKASGCDARRSASNGWVPKEETVGRHVLLSQQLDVSSAHNLRLVELWPQVRESESESYFMTIKLCHYVNSGASSIPLVSGQSLPSDNQRKWLILGFRSEWMVPPGIWMAVKKHFIPWDDHVWWHH